MASDRRFEGIGEVLGVGLDRKVRFESQKWVRGSGNVVTAPGKRVTRLLSLHLAWTFDSFQRYLRKMVVLPKAYNRLMGRGVGCGNQGMHLKYEGGGHWSEEAH